MSNIHDENSYESIGLEDGKSEIILHYQDGKLHGKQQITIPWYNAEFSVINDKLHGEYKEVNYGYNGGYQYRMCNMTNGVATGDYESGVFHGGGGVIVSETVQRQLDSSGNLDGTQILLSSDTVFAAGINTYEVKIILTSCKSNECKIYATYKGQQGGEATNRKNKVYEAFFAKKDSKGKFPRDLKVLLKIIGDEY